MSRVKAIIINEVFREFPPQQHQPLRPARAIREMLRGVSGMQKVYIIRDRADAISSTLAKMQPDDCVLIVGNGN